MTEAGEVYYQDHYRCTTSWDPPSRAQGHPREALFAPYLPPSLPTTTMTLLPPTTPAVHHTLFSPLFLRLLCRPQGLPPGWERCVTEAGEVYYQDNYRCLTSWDPPSQGHPREALVPPTTTPPPLQPPSSTYHPTTLPYHTTTYHTTTTCPQLITVLRESSNDDDCAECGAIGHRRTLCPNVFCTKYLPPSR